jgi:plasmid stabilization system protein ParE
MKIRWSPEAAADFAGIIEHIHNKIARFSHPIGRIAASIDTPWT